MTSHDDRLASSRIGLNQLLGRGVEDAEGKRLGRVVDCLAEREGDQLRVTALMVGRGAWLNRFGWAKGMGGHVLKWQEIETLTPCIRIRPPQMVGDQEAKT